MVVSQKRKDIAILRSMGFETRDVIVLFLSQGLLLGLVGGALGLVLGYVICLYLQTIPFGGGPLGAKATTMKISFQISIYVYAMLLANLSAAVASLLPARAAGKVTPIQIIREGTD